MYILPKYNYITIGLLLLLVTTTNAFTHSLSAQNTKRPNILFVISSDQSYPYASAYGTKACRTPGFDRVAREGVLFHNAYATSPGSTTSRASILTGRMPWQNAEAGTYSGLFPSHLGTYPNELEKTGYLVGYTGKGWHDSTTDSLNALLIGKAYNTLQYEAPLNHITNTDYFANFEYFLDQRNPDQPFCFWFGCHEAQRPFDHTGYQRGQRSLEEATVPAFLPDHPIVRADIMNYITEIEWYDQHLDWMLQKLEEVGELENTLIIVTSDNGMPFPRAKGNCYTQGLRVPLAIAWKQQIAAGQEIKTPVTTLNLAPTIIEATHLRPRKMTTITGTSLLPLLTQKNTRSSQPYVYASRERQASARYSNGGYPQRMIANEEYLYVVNIHPDRYPAGDPYVYASTDNKKLFSAFFDIDDSPTKKLLIEQNKETHIRPYYKAATAKRPAEELYHLPSDPYCTNNLIADSQHKQIAIQLREQLTRYRRLTGDTRLISNKPEIWDNYPTSTPIREFPNID